MDNAAALRGTAQGLRQDRVEKTPHLELGHRDSVVICGLRGTVAGTDTMTSRL